MRSLKRYSFGSLDFLFRGIGAFDGTGNTTPNEDDGTENTTPIMYL